MEVVKKIWYLNSKLKKSRSSGKRKCQLKNSKVLSSFFYRQLIFNWDPEYEDCIQIAREHVKIKTLGIEKVINNISEKFKFPIFQWSFMLNNPSNKRCNKNIHETVMFTLVPLGPSIRSLFLDVLGHPFLKLQN
ncbi:hypothetical protein BpHYR1_004425 [Brachionus plicatilis]|uniref:Uncharacterized protein n=1 Tax=Brachionus plicatilis TaxID=10195 RepID=A0A3M7T4D8_BRAPC|nr:hypothetical protein BpHYR1_004425 [Brachionus plicatilis]